MTAAVAWSPADKPGHEQPADDVVIDARGLTKRYGDRVAVDGLDLEVRRGEIFGLLGPNGAGKTTTVLMLLGLTEPSAGNVTVAGYDPRRESLQVKRRVGYLPDSVGFYGALTGRQNLRYTARLNAIPGRAAEAKIAHVLEQVGLTGRADDRTDAYSRGMRQRLGIADALVKDPEVLILDEPTTAIDPIGVVEILDLIRRLARDSGLAILLASHLLDQVQSVCHRVGIFHQGHVIGLGTVDELAVEFGETTDRLEVAVEGDAAEVAQVQAMLLSVPGVTGAESLQESPGRTAWRLALDPARGAREVGRDVIDQLLAANVRLERFGRSRPSLEQIYRRAAERVATIGDAAWTSGAGGGSIRHDEAATATATAATTAAGPVHDLKDLPSGQRPPRIFRARRSDHRDAPAGDRPDGEKPR